MYRINPSIIRSFCSSSVSCAVVKTPIQVFGIEGRYASAVYSAASKSKSLENVEKDLKEMKKLMSTDTVFCDFIGNPTVNKEFKFSAIDSVANKKKLSDLTKNLLLSMAENGRLSKLANVISSFDKIMSAHRGEIVCEVVTAKQLDAASRAEVEAILKTFLKPGQSLQLYSKVDPSIIGGMKVTIGDKYADMSISSKMKKYISALSAPV